MPVATISSVGQVPSDPAVTSFIFPLALTSLSITSGGTNGGYSMILSGTGFPLNIADAKINICGVEATISSINNIQAEILVP